MLIFIFLTKYRSLSSIEKTIFSNFIPLQYTLLLLRVRKYNFSLYSVSTDDSNEDKVEPDFRNWYIISFFFFIIRTINFSSTMERSIFWVLLDTFLLILLILSSRSNVLKFFVERFIDRNVIRYYFKNLPFLFTIYVLKVIVVFDIDCI